MLERLLPLFLLLLLLPDLYIDWRYLRKSRASWLSTPYRRRWIRQVWWTPSILFAIAAIYLLTSNDYSPFHLAITGQLLLASYFFIFPKLLFTLFSLLGWPFQRLFKLKRNYGDYLGILMAVFVLYILFTGTFIDRHRFTVNHVTYTSPDVPKGFDGYRIVQFSDLHIGTFRNGFEGNVRTIVDSINAQKGNLIVFTGDVVNHRAEELEGFEKTLSQLHAPDGVYTIMGNHDYSMYIPWKTQEEHDAAIDKIIRAERDFGWNMLLNEHVILRQHGDSIALVGSENDGTGHFPHRGNLAKMLSHIEGLHNDTTHQTKLFKVLLSHDPSQWRRKILPQTDIQLMLSGHTHAMQFMIFGFSPAKWIYPEWKGWYKEGNQWLYVNVGVGEVMLPFRFGALPEITVITLKHQ